MERYYELKFICLYLSCKESKVQSVYVFLNLIELKYNNCPNSFLGHIYVVLRAAKFYIKGTILMINIKSLINYLTALVWPHWCTQRGSCIITALEGFIKGAVSE